MRIANDDIERSIKSINIQRVCFQYIVNDIKDFINFIAKR